jgi:hypothetical protein
MPTKAAIDYSNTIIYKITCNNLAIKELYVGHTIDFIQRKKSHSHCSVLGQCKLYKFIRDNGGWENWTMSIIHFFTCTNLYEAKQKEQEYFELLHATLNSVEPIPKCKPCNKVKEKEKEQNKEQNNYITNSNPITNILSQKAPFTCNTCNFSSRSKKDYSKHLLTQKHIKKMFELKNKDLQNLPKQYKCECGNEYKYNQGLWKHKQTCVVLLSKCENESNLVIATTSNPNNEDIIMTLINHNKELTDKIVDICKTSITNKFDSNNNIMSTSNVNSHKKTFNLQLFLNETCKDAINISEFVDSIKLELDDLMNFGELGYVEGMSNIIVKNLNAMNEIERPIHCTDKKRKIFYIKDENKWEKESEDLNKLRKIIFRISNENIKMLQIYKDLHPECNFNESKYTDKYNKLVIEVMGGAGNNDVEKENKIIKNISRNVTITK